MPLEPCRCGFKPWEKLTEVHLPDGRRQWRDPKGWIVHTEGDFICEA